MELFITTISRGPNNPRYPVFRTFIGFYRRFQWIFEVPVKGGRDYITPQKAIYKWYILPIGGLYATYHPLKEPEKSIDVLLGMVFAWRIIP